MARLMLIGPAYCLALLVLFSGPVAADDQDKPLADRVKIPIHLAKTYTFTGIKPDVRLSPGDMKTALGRIPVQAPGAQIGWTYFDIQHDCTMGRQIEHRNTNYLHFTWTDYTGDNGVDYQAYNICGQYLYFPGEAVEVTGDAAYASLDADTACAIPAAHFSDTDPQAYWDFDPESLQFGSEIYGLFFPDSPTDIYGHYEGAPNLWPKIEWDTDGNETVLHMVATESAGGNARTISYYRRTGGYGVGLGTWSPLQVVIDTVVNISVTVAASPISDKVAIVWNAPADYRRDTPDEFANQYENDVWFAASSNAGTDWLALPPGTSIGQSIDMGIGGGYGPSGGNITSYSPCGLYKAFCDLSALISRYTDNIHTVWGCRRWNCDLEVYRRRSAIFHWSEDTDTITTVVKAEWDTGGTCYAYDMAGDAAKMTIAECDEKLYVLYTQFGNVCDPCVDYDFENNIMNGELFLTVSDDNGRHWDRPDNLTDTETPGCAASDCESEYWASMARYGRFDTCGENSGQWVLDILYIDDKAPGTCLQTESGVWTINPVMWHTIPCREFVSEPPPFYFVHITDSHIGSLFHRGSDDRLEMAVQKINDFDPPPAFVIFSGDLVAYGGGEVGRNNYDEFNDIMSGLDPSIPYYTTPGNHDARYNSGIDNYKDKIRSDLDYVEDIDSLSIRVVSMYSGSDKSVLAFKKICLGWLCVWLPWIDGHPEGAGLTDDQYNWLHDRLVERPDLRKILFTHHPIVWCSKKDAYGSSENNCGNACIYDNRHGAWDLLKDPDSNGNDSDAVKVALSGHTHEEDFMYRSDDADDARRIPRADWITSACDTLTGLLPLHVNTGDLADDLCYRIVYMDGKDFKVSRTYYFDRTLSSSAFWAGSEEEGGKTTASNDTTPAGRVHVLYVNGPDTTHVVGKNDLGGVDLMTGATYANYYIWDDSTQDSIYPGENVSVIMDTSFYIVEYEATDSSILSIHTGFTKENGCRITFSHIGIPAPAGSKGRLWAHGDYIDTLLYWCDNDGDEIVDTVYPPGDYTPGCDCTPGDANGDETFNVGDAVYIVSYIFKGGPPPTPFNPCSGDPDCSISVNVGDAVYLINYVFKGGPPPCSCEEWLEAL